MSVQKRESTQEFLIAELELEGFSWISVWAQVALLSSGSPRVQAGGQEGVCLLFRTHASCPGSVVVFRGETGLDVLPVSCLDPCSGFLNPNSGLYIDQGILT